MGIKVTGLKSLDGFEKRLRKMQTGELANRVAVALAEEGVKIAQDEYKYTGFDDVSVYYENNGDGTARIIAEGEGLNYIEFGIGLVGLSSNYPKDKLPSDTLQFESPKGHPQTTQGWEYNYPNPLTKVDGSHWWYDGELTSGQPAGFQMFNTAEMLKSSVNRIVKNELKGGGK